MLSSEIEVKVGGGDVCGADLKLSISSGREAGSIYEEIVSVRGIKRASALRLFKAK